MEKVCSDRAPVFITRKNGEPVVMLSLEEYDAWEEILYLTRSKTNKKRLAQAMDDVEQGSYQTHALIEE